MLKWWGCVQLAETLLNEDLDVDRRFELCFEDLRKGKHTFQATSLPVKQAWCDLLRRWLRKWGAEPSVAVPFPKTYSCKGQRSHDCTVFYCHCYRHDGACTFTRTIAGLAAEQRRLKGKKVKVVNSYSASSQTRL